MNSSANVTGTQDWWVGVVLLGLGLVLSVAAATRTSRVAYRATPVDDGRTAVTALTWLLGATAAAAFGAGVLSTGELSVAGVGPFVLAGLIVVVPASVRPLRRRGDRDG